MALGCALAAFSFAGLALALPSSSISLGGAIIINLDTDRSRWERTSAQLSASALIWGTPGGFSKISGTVAATLDLPRLVADGSLAPEAYNDIVEQDHAVTGVELTLGALGCLDSHVKAWRSVVAAGVPMLILEDDVTLTTIFDVGLAEALGHLPADFGLLYLANVIGAVVRPHLLPYDVSRTGPSLEYSYMPFTISCIRLRRKPYGAWTADTGVPTPTSSHPAQLQNC